MQEFLTHVYSVAAFIFLFIAIFFFAKLINDFLTPYNIDEQLTTKDNTALAISFSGHLLAIVIIFIGALLGPTKNLGIDLLSVGGYSMLGIVLLNLSRYINDKIILRKFSNVKEIVTDRNSGVGAVQFGTYVATALVLAGAIHGEGGGPLSAIIFFVYGQVALIIFSFIYNLITPFDLHEELEKDNVAAGVAFGGTLVALGIILLMALSGNFVSWQTNSFNFLIYSLIGFVILPIFRFFFDKVIIPKSSLNHEIKHDRNVGAALLEMTIAIGFATIIFFLLKD